MLVYLNALTWTHEPEELSADLREAMRVGLHLQTCHAFPSSIDPGCRHALEFSRIMNATPADLKKWPTNIYSEIAIALKGGKLRKPGLAIAWRRGWRSARAERSRPPSTRLRRGAIRLESRGLCDGSFR